MEQNKKSISVLKFTYIFGICTFLLYIIACLTASIVTNNWSYFNSSLFCTSAGVLSIYLGDLNGKLITSFAKNQGLSKFWKYFVLILVNMFKMVLIIVPLLTILLLMHYQPNNNAFDVYAIIGGTFISPCYIIISQVVLVKLNKKNVTR